MADPKDFNVEDAREKLKALDAFLFDNMENTDQLLLGDAEINIAWRLSTPDALPDLRYYIENYTWTTNAKPQRYVVDPEIKGEPIKGTWRQAYVRDFKRVEQGVDFYYLILALRKGYIETLLVSGAFNWSEARLEQDRQLPATTSPGSTTVSEFLIVKWNNISPYKIDAVKAEIETQDANAFHPVIRKEDLGANFHRLYVASNIETDGSGTISLLLAQPEFTLQCFQAYGTDKSTTVTYYWDVPRTLAQGVISALALIGVSTIPSYNPTQGLVDIVAYKRDFTEGSITGLTLQSTCAFTMYGDLYWGTTSPNNYTCPTYAPGYMYYKDVNNNGDGSYDVIIRTRKANYRNYATMQTYESPLMERYERSQMSVTTQAVPSIDVNLPGFIYRQNLTPNDDCASNYDTSYDKAIANMESIRLVRSTLLEDIYETVYHNYATADNSTPHVAGYIYAFNSNMNNFGVYDNTGQIRKAKAATVAIHQTATNLFEVDYEKISRNSSSVVIAPDHVVGFIYRASNNLTDFATYDASEMTKKAVEVDIPTRCVSETAFVYDYERIERNHAAVLQASPNTPGYIYVANSDANGFGLYDNTERFKVSKEVDTGRRCVLSSGAKEVYDRIIRNKASVLDITTGIPGYIYRAMNDLNDFKVYDVSEQIIKSTPIELYHVFNTSYGQGWIRVFRNEPLATLNGWLDDLPYNPHISIQIQDDLTYDGTLMYSPGAINSATTFSGASANWISNDFVYDSTRKKVYKYSYHNYRQFFAVRQDAADAMNNGFRCTENDKPRYEHGLWEAVYATTPTVTAADTSLFG